MHIAEANQTCHATVLFHHHCSHDLIGVVFITSSFLNTMLERFCTEKKKKEKEVFVKLFE